MEKQRMIRHPYTRLHIPITSHINHHFLQFPPPTQLLAGVLWLQSRGRCPLLHIKEITPGLLSISSRAHSGDPLHFQAVAYSFVSSLNHAIQHTTSVNHLCLPGSKRQVERPKWPQEEFPSVGDKEAVGAFVSWEHLCSHTLGVKRIWNSPFIILGGQRVNKAELVGKYIL